MTKKTVFLGFLLWAIATIASRATQPRTTDAAGADGAVPYRPIDVERLPDMNVPRAGHALVMAGGEFVVAGGHTTGFIPTPTAEYLSGDRWHLMEMAYPHDDGIYVPLRSGEVLLAGGHEKSLGIGQTFAVERYSPERHAFEGFGCLDQKRALASAVELSDGRVVVAGNWYADDAIEVFDGHSAFAFVRNVSVRRPTPYVLATSDGDALILGGTFSDGAVHPCDTIDRLLGEPFADSLLARWVPQTFDVPHLASHNAAMGKGQYLLFARDSLGQYAFLHICDTVFSLLPTNVPVPAVSQWGNSLLYYSSAVVDSATRKVYVLAADDSLRRYVLCADYGQTDSCGRAVLSMGFTPPLPDLGYAHPLLTPQGNLLMTGGILTSNYAPQATVYIFYVGNPGEVVSRTSLLSRRFMGLSVGLGLLIIALAAASLAGYCRYRKQSRPTQETAPTAPKPETEDGGPETLRSASMPLPGNLMPRIREMMTREQLFLNSELKVSDVAARLGVNNRSVSDCINSAAGCSFSQFVNAYRIDYAKQLMTSQPDMKMSALYMEVGFSNETSFFRTFKSLTGMTPTEWRQKKE